MELGMITGESNEVYHGNEAVSTSTIKDFIKSPYLYYRKYVAKDVERSETAAMTFGSMAHTFILEPEAFEKEYVVMPDGIDRRTKDGKAAYAEIEDSGKKIVSASDYKAVLELRKAIDLNPTAKLMLSNGVAEVSWRIDAGAYKMQSRTDWFVESCNEEQAEELRKHGLSIKAGDPVIVDLKTTQSLEDWEMQNYGNVIFKYGYQLQLGFYLAVINKIRKQQGKEIVRHFLFVVVEKSAPNDCAVIALDEKTFALAQTQLKHHLAELTKCYKTGEWKGWNSRGVVVCGIPENIISREEQEIFEARDFSKITF